MGEGKDVPQPAAPGTLWRSIQPEQARFTCDHEGARRIADALEVAGRSDRAQRVVEFEQSLYRRRDGRQVEQRIVAREDDNRARDRRGPEAADQRRLRTVDGQTVGERQTFFLAFFRK